MPDFTHFLVTRFNVLTGYGPLEGVSDEWMMRRLGLFSRFAVPSIRAQTQKNFTWILAVDPATSPLFRRRIEILTSDLGVEVIQLDCPRPFDRPVMAEIARRTSTPYVATTRFDNDDALASVFFEKISHRMKDLPAEDCQFVEFPSGHSLNLSTGVLRAVIFENNAFATCLERAASARGVYFKNHRFLSDHGPMTRIKGEPGWLEVIHGENVKNRERTSAGIVDDASGALVRYYGLNLHG